MPKSYLHFCVHYSSFTVVRILKQSECSCRDKEKEGVGQKIETIRLEGTVWFIAQSAYCISMYYIV